MRIPNGDLADLGTKVEEYILNPAHPDGKHKARVFESVLGISLANAHLLRDALLNAVKVSDSAVAKGDNGFGDVFAVETFLSTEIGSGNLVSVWIIRRNEDFPRLVTAYLATR